MKKILLSLWVCTLWCMGHATENDAIYCWAEGSTNCYQLDQFPKVTYADSCAVLTLNGDATPILTIPLVGGKQLKVTYGVYIPTALKNETIAPISTDGKFIKGGRLIIVKEGKQYDINGNIIK